MASSELTTPDAPERLSEGRVRWRRFGAMLGSSAVAGAVLLVLTAQGVLAAQFAISGLPFVVTANSLNGNGFEQFGALDLMVPGSPNEGDTGGQVIVVTSAIQTATLSNLCQSVSIGAASLKITAGGSSPVRATTLIVDSVDLTGDAQFNNIEIGRDASTFDRVPGVVGPVGMFGQQAETVTINNLRQTNFATTAASFTLPGLHLSFSDTGC